MSRKRPQPPVKPFKKKPNPLKAAKVTEIDYKDVALLRKFISERPRDGPAAVRHLGSLS